MLDFIKANFTVLLLSFFIILFTGITLLVFAKFGGSKDAVSWTTNAFSGFMGALLGLIVGTSTAANRRASDQTPKQD